jgi:1,4-alpha-glucan branching enzyme
VERKLHPALSHDEVVHGKGSLKARCRATTGSASQTSRLLYAFMWAYPGKKLLFMGGEFGQSSEWYHETSLEWHLLDQGPYHRGLSSLVRDLNHLYREERALHQLDADPGGIPLDGLPRHEQGVIAFVRFALEPGQMLL